MPEVPMPERLTQPSPPGTDRELRLDPHREERTGVAEAVYAPGKSPAQCAAAVGGLLARSRSPVLLTRADPAQAGAATAAHPGAIVAATGSGSATLSILTWRPARPRAGWVAILTAGTSDGPVAREAEAVLAAYGVGSEVICDVGVAGIHRVLEHTDRLTGADVVIVVAGMEGALASVATGLTRAPVIAVPTSTGYGAGFEGVTALLGMLASCSPGVSVVGIDNGFGAACAALRILNLARPAQPGHLGSA
jgi:pyridinium-3,5-biscarboxylic acid mononucleotide synthase